MRKKILIKSILILICIIILGFLTLKVKSYLVSFLNSINSNTNAISQISLSLNDMNNKVERQYINDELSNCDVELFINDEQVKLDLTSNNVSIYANKLTSEFPNKIGFKSSDDIKVYFDGKDLENFDEFEIDKIQKNSYKNIKIIKGSFERNYKLELLPSSFPNISISNNELIDGDIYSSFTGQDSYIYKMNKYGEVTFYLKGQYGSYGDLMNFNKHISKDGKIRYSYFEPEVQTTLVRTPGINYGHIVLLDEHYNVIKKIGLKKTNLNTETLAENHEFIYFDDDHYIISGAVGKTILFNGESTVVKAAYFQEIKNDKVIFEWISTSDESLLQESVEGNKYIDEGNKEIADYVHINSIDIDPKDNNFICSFRNQNSVVKINRETGKIIWKLSGKGDSFNLTDEQKFSRQHYAKYQEDGSILLFDNGNDKGQTRILKFKIDEKEKKVIDFKEYKLDSKFSYACGSVQSYDLENEIFTIGWGMSKTDQTIMSVVDFKNNKIIAEIYTDRPISTYRSLIFK